MHSSFVKQIALKKYPSIMAHNINFNLDIFANFIHSFVTKYARITHGDFRRVKLEFRKIRLIYTPTELSNIETIDIPLERDDDQAGSDSGHSSRDFDEGYLEEAERLTMARAIKNDIIKYYRLMNEEEEEEEFAKCLLIALPIPYKICQQYKYLLD